MNKKIMVVAGVIVVIALAGFAYTRRSSAPVSPGPQTQSQALDEAAEFARAIESGRPTLCTLTKGTETMEYLVKGKMMRANISSTVEGRTTLSHMINDEKYFYTWSDDQKQGTKMSLAVPSASPTGNDVATGDTAPDFTDESDYNSLTNEGYTINCRAGSVSNDDFVPPADIQFVDPSAMMQAIPTPGTNGQIDYQQLQEQYSDYLPEEN